MKKLKYVKLFESFVKVEYKAVPNKDGKWEIHMKNPVDKEFKLPSSGTLWTNSGKYYSSEGEAIGMIKSLDDSHRNIDDSHRNIPNFE